METESGWWGCLNPAARHDSYPSLTGLTGPLYAQQIQQIGEARSPAFLAVCVPLDPATLAGNLQLRA
jgi:hypothetical protein